MFIHLKLTHSHERCQGHHPPTNREYLDHSPCMPHHWKKRDKGEREEPILYQRPLYMSPTTPVLPSHSRAAKASRGIKYSSAYPMPKTKVKRCFSLRTMTEPLVDVFDKLGVPVAAAHAAPRRDPGPGSSRVQKRPRRSDAHELRRTARPVRLASPRKAVITTVIATDGPADSSMCHRASDSGGRRGAGGSSAATALSRLVRVDNRRAGPPREGDLPHAGAPLLAQARHASRAVRMQALEPVSAQEPAWCLATAGISRRLCPTASIVA